MFYLFFIIGILFGCIVCLYLFKREKICQKYKKVVSFENQQKFCYVCILLLNGWMSAMFYQLQKDAILSALFVLLHTCILCMVMLDVYYQTISNRFFLFLFIIGIILSLYQSEIRLYERMIAFCIGGMPLLLLSHLFKNAIGNGDGLFLGVLGFIVGIKGILLVFVFGYMLASGYALLLLLKKRGHRKTKIAMFPFFYLALMLYILYTPQIYQSFNMAR